MLEIAFDDLLAEPAYRVDLRRRAPKGYDDHAVHVLVIEHCHPEGQHPQSEADRAEHCWDGEWSVLHPPTCYRPSDLGAGCCDRCDAGPAHRCGLDYDLENRGDEVFDVYTVDPRSWPDKENVADVLPAGSYLCRWYFEDSPACAPHWEYDARSGVELVPGPVPVDLPGWS